jgi:magnesium chelatase family protein
MVGPLGADKSMLAARLSGILPPLEPAEALGIR